MTGESVQGNETSGQAVIGESVQSNETSGHAMIGESVQSNETSGQAVIGEPVQSNETSGQAMIGESVQSNETSRQDSAKIELNSLVSKSVPDLKEIAKEVGVKTKHIRSCGDDGKDALIQLIESRIVGAEPVAKKRRAKGLAPHIVERRAEHRSMIEESSLRSTWSDLAENGWDARHHIIYENKRLHPNYRSYFDRRLLRRDELEELGVDHPPVLKPSWRLNTDGLHPDEKEAQEAILHSTGACATPYIGKTVDLAHPSTFSTPASIHDPNYASPSGSNAIPSALKAVMSRQPSNNPFVWSDRHHIVWCNERNTSGKKLNPVQLRCYFDRMRLPHNCRCEVPVKNVRVLPNWRLRTDPATGNDLGDSADSKQQGNGSRHHSTSSHFEKRETAWNTRHELVFKNEEVSRLDRCYFDRWREPDANLQGRCETKDGSPCRREIRSLKPTWSLDREGSPDRAAKELLKKTAARGEPFGTWNSRHQRTFANNIHTNLKAYFDRPRPAEEMSGAKKNKKTGLSEKLGVDWSLQELGSIDYPPTLRANSEPALSKGGHQKRNQKPAWFSSHGVTFLSRKEHSQMREEEKKIARGGLKQVPHLKPALPDCIRNPA